MKFSDKLSIVQLVSFLCYFAAAVLLIGTLVLSVIGRQLILAGLLYSAGTAFYGLLLSPFIDLVRRVDIIQHEVRLLRLEFHEANRRQSGT